MKIICIGLNYRKHALEMGWSIPGEPVVFLKPDSSLLKNNKPFFPYPSIIEVESTFFLFVKSRMLSFICYFLVVHRERYTTISTMEKCL